MSALGLPAWLSGLGRGLSDPDFEAKKRQIEIGDQIRKEWIEQLLVRHGYDRDRSLRSNVSLGRIGPDITACLLMIEALETRIRALEDWRDEP